MIIQPKVRGFICTAAHPKGCFRSVQEQVDYVKAKGSFEGPKNVLIIGASTGYGLASGVALMMGAQAKIVGVSFERPSDGRRTASPGWYNTAAFEQLAQEGGYFARSIQGDAFSYEIKQKTIALLKEHVGPVDLVIYSVAAPRRIHPDTGEVLSSVLKPIGAPYSSKTIDPISGVVKEITIEPATPQEIAATEAVMGGEDWEMWITQLEDAGLLAPKAITLAYSYIGPALTHPIYKNGTIGRAKMHLSKTAHKLNQRLSAIGGRALISVNKALVTQASSAIPVVPLYISLLYKGMKKRGTHEGCIEQMDRLFREKLYGKGAPVLDENQMVRLDDWEMEPGLQAEIAELWKQVNTENVESLTDIQGYRIEFYQLFGFNHLGMDYTKETDPEVNIPSLEGELQAR